MSDFVERINKNWPDFVINPGRMPADSCESPDYDLDSDSDIDCGDCRYCAPDKYPDESYFSWQSCDSCDSRLGGDRADAVAIHKDCFGPDATSKEMYEISICVDCLMYHANGDLPESESA